MSSSTTVLQAHAETHDARGGVSTHEATRTASQDAPEAVATEDEQIVADRSRGLPPAASGIDAAARRHQLVPCVVGVCLAHAEFNGRVRTAL